MRLKERIDALEARTEALEMACRYLASLTDAGRLFEEPGFKDEFITEMAAEFRAQAGAGVDESWATRMADALYQDVQALLDVTLDEPNDQSGPRAGDEP